MQATDFQPLAKGFTHAKLTNGDIGYVAIKSGETIYLKKGVSPSDFLCTYFMFASFKEILSELDKLTTAPKSVDAEVSYIIKDIELIAGVNYEDNLIVLNNSELSDNCAAVRYDNKKYIIINNNFLNKISRNFDDKYPVYAILAHEIAHHINDHMRDEKSSVSDELDADYFTGKVLKCLGLEEKELEKALLFMDNYPHGGTHPPLAERKQRIKSGWLLCPNPDNEQTIRLKLKKVRGYDDVSVFRNGIAVVKKGDLYGYINLLGREIFPVQFEKAGSFNNLLKAKVKMPGKNDYYFITPSGKISFE